MFRWALGAVVLLAVPGCGLTGYEDSSRLDPADIKSLVDKAPYPEMIPAANAVQPAKITVKPDGTRSIEINLVDALRLSLANNQAWLGRTEGLDLQLLSLELLRRQWWPTLSPLMKSATCPSARSSAAVSTRVPWSP